MVRCSDPVRTGALVANHGRAMRLGARSERDSRARRQLAACSSISFVRSALTAWMITGCMASSSCRSGGLSQFGLLMLTTIQERPRGRRLHSLITAYRRLGGAVGHTPWQFDTLVAAKYAYSSLSNCQGVNVRRGSPSARIPEITHTGDEDHAT